MDWNNDKSYDLLVGDADGHVHVFLNTTGNTNPTMASGYLIQVGGRDITVGMRATPVVNDWNEDGRKDLLIGNFNGNITIYLNEGTDAAPIFNSSHLLEVGGGAFDAGSRVAPRIFDWDKDGLKDILVGEFKGYVYFLKNIASNGNPVFKRRGKLFLKNGNALHYPSSANAPRSRLFVTDWNNDGRDDILVGGVDGKVMVFLASPVSSYSLSEYWNKSLKLSRVTLLKLKSVLKLHAKSLKNSLFN